MTTDKMREEFEAAAKGQGLSIARTTQVLTFANGHRRSVGDYIDPLTLAAWWAWRVSRAAVVVELPEAFDTECGWRIDRDDTVQAIEAAGLKVAP